MNKALPGAFKSRSSQRTGKATRKQKYPLQDENEGLQQYLNISPFIFLMLDVDGKLRLINKKGCEILGYRSKAEVLGKSWFSNFAPLSKRKVYRKIFSRVIENNTNIVAHGHREAPTLKKDGTLSFIKWNYALARGTNGKPSGIICFGEDITAKKELEAKFMKAMLEAQELERRRLAKDIHDGLAVLLTGAKLNLAAIGVAGAMPERKKKKLIDNTIALLTSALSEIRTITLNLSPVVVHDFGLAPALKDLCEKLNKSHRIRIKLRSSGINNRLAPSAETGIYRIAQELIHNAIKHSRAKKIHVQLFRQNNMITLTVEDDGTGFDTNRLFDHNGRGLKNVRSRVKHLHGFFHMESFRKKGTMAMVEIPVKP